MCLIIDKPANLAIPASVIEDFINYNQDGMGYMYHTPETGLVVQKFHNLTLDQIQEEFAALTPFRAIIHLRMRTHGGIDHINTHPYPIFENNLYLVHNGVLSGNAGSRVRSAMSDTWHYIEDTLRPLLLQCPELLQNPAFIELVEEHIGSSNKFVLMDKNGHVTYFNEDAFIPLVSASGDVNIPEIKVSNTYAWSYNDLKYVGKSFGTNLRNYGGAFQNYGNKYLSNYEDDSYDFTPATNDSFIYQLDSSDPSMVFARLTRIELESGFTYNPKATISKLLEMLEELWSIQHEMEADHVDFCSIFWEYGLVDFTDYALADLEELITNAELIQDIFLQYFESEVSYLEDNSYVEDNSYDLIP